MQWVVAAIVGLGVGVLVGVLGARQRRRRLAAAVPAGPRVGLDDLLGMLRAGALVVGAHDEVLRSNVTARTLGLARGNRIAVPDVLEAVREARRSGAPLTRDLTYQGGLGAPQQHVTVRISPHGDDVVVLAEDLTALVRVDQTRRDFVANVSHELKTPIGAVQILAEAIEQAPDDPEAVGHFAGRLRAESSRLAEMVSQIIELSRLQADEPLIDAEPLLVGDLMADARRRCAELADKRGITVLVAGRQDDHVWGNRELLASALTNLVQNAIAYSDRGGRVSISSRSHGDGEDAVVELAVTDNGIGIKPEDQERIFERFYRVNYDRSRSTGGTGLGLAIVKHVAAVHGGTVNVWSRVGQGSTFTLRLPASAGTVGEVGEPAVPASHTPVPTGGASPRPSSHHATGRPS